MKPKYPFPGLTKAQKRILDELACGNYSLAKVFPHPKSIQKLLDMGLIERCGDRRFGQGWFSVTVPEYQMPIAAHQAWCEYQGALSCVPDPI